MASYEVFVTSWLNSTSVDTTFKISESGIDAPGQSTSVARLEGQTRCSNDGHKYPERPWPYDRTFFKQFN